ncbi:MAG TPA: hypothetical protein PK513_06860 [Alphaproteobacteria bacterium]|nr:hypothetical protein [Alphaproteobacteria bacterium]USO05568.1 MAG: hypothetical protein H6859_10675 [Rhodospirillales bacterium]HOO82205.1 hypothetical protein [Alphaproteobacteria bacterium]
MPSQPPLPIGKIGKAGISNSASLSPTSSPFSPLNLSPVLWFDASDVSTITQSAGAVSQWDDKSGNNYHVTQGTATNQPTTGTRTLNSLNVLDFDGTDRLLASVSDYPETATVLIVGEVDTLGTSGFSRSLFSIDGAADYQEEAGNSTQYLFQINSTQHTNIKQGTTDLIGSPHIFQYVHDLDTNSAAVYVDGVAGGSANNYNTAYSATQSLQVGANRAQNTPHIGGISEIIIYDKVLTAQENTDVLDYLTNKWGL